MEGKRQPWSYIDPARKMLHREKRGIYQIQWGIQEQRSSGTGHGDVNLLGNRLPRRDGSLRVYMGIRRSFSKSSMSGLRGSLEAASAFSDRKKVIYFNSKETSYNIKVFIQLKMHSQVQIFIHFPHNYSQQNFKCSVVNHLPLLITMSKKQKTLQVVTRIIVQKYK